jgi:hypothetical protein
MFPYHNRIKERIKKFGVVRFEYNDISPCLLLYFSTEREIRQLKV